VFLDALQTVKRQRKTNLVVSGVEHSRSALQGVIEGKLLTAARAIHSDFLDVNRFPVDAVVGNPPYVRLRHLPEDEASRALSRAKEVLGKPMDPSGSLWMPFVLHAMRFLTPGGRLAFVLPYDLTYVRYARPLWEALGKQFGSLRVARVRERLFPEILQEVVVLYADEFGNSTKEIQFETFDTCDNFLANRPRTSSVLQVDHVVKGRRVFVEALIPAALRAMIDDVVMSKTVPVGELAKIRIGYVSGDKKFFHPDSDVVDKFGLDKASLRAVLTSSRQLRNRGVTTSSCDAQSLFLPPADGPLTSGDRDYVAHGVTKGVAKRYKCQVRKPWFHVPGVTIPELVFPVFAQRPLVLLNDAQLAVSNSLLCGYLDDPTTAESFLAGWYTSLTVLQLELNVHALGGGVLVLVPREVSNMRIVPDAPASPSTLNVLDERVAAGDLDGAFEYGDQNVLAGSLGLSKDELAMIAQGCEDLARWRTSAAARAPEVEEAAKA
jgi:hypothetical protein